MIRNPFIILICSCILTLTAGCKEENRQDADNVTETGTAITGAAVVRSATLILSGAINTTMEAPRDETTTLVGNCSPDMWANFGIKFNPPGYVWVAVTIMTKDPIQPGQTGPVKLDWVDVTLFTEDMKSLQYKGPGSFEIKQHDAAVDNRRMIGVIQANGMEGKQDAEGQTLNATFDFDINFSCGIIKG